MNFMAIKPQKNAQNGHISVCNFYPIVVTKKAFWHKCAKLFREFRQNFAKIQNSKQMVTCKIKLRSHIQNFKRKY